MLSPLGKRSGLLALIRRMLEENPVAHQPSSFSDYSMLLQRAETESRAGIKKERVTSASAQVVVQNPYGAGVVRMAIALLAKAEPLRQGNRASVLRRDA